MRGNDLQGAEAEIFTGAARPPDLKSWKRFGLPCSGGRLQRVRRGAAEGPRIYCGGAADPARDAVDSVSLVDLQAATRA